MNIRNQEWITLGVAVILFIACCASFQGFLSFTTVANMLNDGAYLGVIAIGMTFVILTGGIDLSVGSLVGLSGILAAKLIEQLNWHPIIACTFVLLLGVCAGLLHGTVITRCKIAPFLVTLAGLFFYKGIALAISKESVRIDNMIFTSWSRYAINLPSGSNITIGSLIFAALLFAAIFVERQTRFGRSLRAVGGDESSARLMGLHVDRSKVCVYALSGFCAALGGVLFTLYTSSGNATSGSGIELDAIACVVIGGASLSGGFGSIFGSFLGLMVIGIIQTAILFQGTLSSWWTRIFIAAILLVFVLLRQLSARKVR